MDPVTPQGGNSSWGNKRMEGGEERTPRRGHKAETFNNEGYAGGHLSRMDLLT